MTGKLILMKARQSRIAALESLESSRTSPRLTVKMAHFRTRRIRGGLALEETLFQSFDERLLAA